MADTVSAQKENKAVSVAEMMHIQGNASDVLQKANSTWRSKKKSKLYFISC
jgi:hypothetical protein